MIDKVKQGKANKRRGGDFELRVRHKLEEEGWIVCKWHNNVEFEVNGGMHIPERQIEFELKQGKIIPARQKFNPFRKVMSMGTGFPDFIAHRRLPEHTLGCYYYEVIGVESKMAKYLTREEKEKCRWYLDNKIFSRILVAHHSNEGKVIFEEFL